MENRLSELWSIMDWASPGLLGHLESFTRRVAVPIERHRDPVATTRFAAMMRPFLLRRKKSDPAIAPELPPKIETDRIVPLTAEQVTLCEAVVQETMTLIEASEGIERAGLVFVADALDGDPFLLRGRTRDEVLAGLRSRRRGQRAIPAQTTPITQARPCLPRRPASSWVWTPAPRWQPATIHCRRSRRSPVPPLRPGHPAALPVDPPPGHEGLRDALLLLAADATARAWQLATGESENTGLDLTEEEDLARRAARLLGTPRFETFAARCGMNPRELFRWGLAWRHGGAAGYVRATDGWEPCGPPHHDPEEVTRRWRSATAPPR